MNPKVGDCVLVKPNALFKGTKPYHVVLIEVGEYPSMWLPPGKKRWGARWMLDKNMPSSPMLRDQFTWNDETREWELQLL